MATDLSVVALIGNLTTTLSSVTSALPDPESSSEFAPPAEGISLLDVKNEILLSYLQNLVFLIILKLRHVREDEGSDGDYEEAVKKMVELRIYLERGVRPLEGKLKYQIDKVVRAAEEADRRAAQKSSAAQDKEMRNGASKADFDDSASDSESHGSEASAGDGDTSIHAEAAAGPRPAALLRAKQPSTDTTTTRTRSTATGAYKPPRIQPTAMPEPERRSDAPARKRRSALLDEYIDDEISNTPRAQPSIGSNSTILARGRSGLSARDRAREKERTDYEERNFTRLPQESKREKRERKSRGGNKRDVFGGEDWTGLGGLGDRIGRSVEGRKGGVMERREKRKRERETTDMPRQEGRVGEAFEKRRKVLAGREEKKRRGR